MTPLGKSIVFYLKYLSEMERLYKGEGGELEGLAEPEKTREMARSVGDKAYRQAADLLELCGAEIEKHFSSIGKCTGTMSRKIIERKWSVSYSVWPKGKKSPAKPKLMAGIDIRRKDKELVPWFWRSGSDEAEQLLDMILKGNSKVKSQEVELRPGSVGLGRIQILPTELVGFDVDREPFVEQVRKAFLSITPLDLDALWPR
jgi:hypothetical protein